MNYCKPEWMDMNRLMQSFYRQPNFFMAKSVALIIKNEELVRATRLEF